MEAGAETSRHVFANNLLAYQKTILNSLYQVYPTSVIFTIVPEYPVINREVSQDSEQEQKPVQSGLALE